MSLRRRAPLRGPGVALVMHAKAVEANAGVNRPSSTQGAASSGSEASATTCPAGHLPAARTKRAGRRAAQAAATHMGSLPTVRNPDCLFRAQSYRRRKCSPPHGCIPGRLGDRLARSSPDGARHSRRPSHPAEQGVRGESQDQAVADLRDQERVGARGEERRGHRPASVDRRGRRVSDCDEYATHSAAQSRRRMAQAAWLSASGRAHRISRVPPMMKGASTRGNPPDSPVRRCRRRREQRRPASPRRR
jgi:hypothetical protein